MHINLTQVESSVARLIDESQEAVVVSAHHPLSRHKAIAAALWKARRTRTEQAVEQGDGKSERGRGGPWVRQPAGAGGREGLAGCCRVL
jgi:hypothetical protein